MSEKDKSLYWDAAACSTVYYKGKIPEDKEYEIDCAFNDLEDEIETRVMAFIEELKKKYPQVEWSMEDDEE